MTRTKVTAPVEEVDRRKELQEALKIDKHDLDTMLVEQSSLYHEAADQHALAMSRRDKAEADMKEVKADLDYKLRRGKEKLSETQLANQIIAHEDFQTAQTNYLNHKKKTDRWFALKEAYGDRNYMLKELCQLYVAGYYMNSSGGKTRADAAGRTAEQNNAEAGEKRFPGRNA